MQKQKINKKSQFYLFTAIILCTYLFALVSATAQKMEESDKFGIIKENFVKESSFAINSALYNNSNISQRFEQFSLDFIDYAKTKGIDLELLYCLVQDKIEINNYLNTVVKINNHLLNKGEKLVLNKTDQIVVEAYNISYALELSDEPLQLKSILRAEENNNVQVYILK